MYEHNLSSKICFGFCAIPLIISGLISGFILRPHMMVSTHRLGTTALDGVHSCREARVPSVAFRLFDSLIHPSAFNQASCMMPCDLKAWLVRPN